MNPHWKQAVAYQIYPRSFNDSNNDGIGDIPGIIQKLDYLQQLGVGIIWLSPVYKSPQKDNGYDVSDYRDIDPIFGTMDDMDQLIREADQRNIKLVMDLVMNHTSNQHEWFENSRKGIQPYADYYIWRDGKEDGPPNNWTSIFSGSAWEYDDMRKQYYLHLFAKEQPDLNYHNPNVLQEIVDIMKFWLDRGIYGFRCDAINVIYKSSLNDGKTDGIFIGREHYLSQPGNHEILQYLNKEVLAHYDTYTVGEAGHVDYDTARLFTDRDRHELNSIFTFEHLETNWWKLKWFKTKLRPKRFFQSIANWQVHLDWNTIVLENHDQMRSVSQFGNDGRYWYESATLLSTLLLTLRGTPYIYQGQEIGMKQVPFQRLDQINDIEALRGYDDLKRWHLPKWIRRRLVLASTRDQNRTPMQWDSSRYTGFSDATPPVCHPNPPQHITVAAQKSDNHSVLTFYKQLIALRNSDEILQLGEYETLQIDSSVFAFKRKLKHKQYIIILNLGKGTRRVSYTGEVIISNYNRTSFEGLMKSYEAIILQP